MQQGVNQMQSHYKYLQCTQITQINSPDFVWSQKPRYPRIHCKRYDGLTSSLMKEFEIIAVVVIFSKLGIFSMAFM